MNKQKLKLKDNQHLKKIYQYLKHYVKHQIVNNYINIHQVGKYLEVRKWVIHKKLRYY